MSTEIQKDKNGKAIAVYDYGDDAGRGYEHQDKADVSVPFINILQTGSPIVIDGKAKAGDMFNTVTGEIYDRDKGIYFVPATTRHRCAIWRPRESGGGFMGNKEMDDPVVLKAIKNASAFGKYRDDEGNIVSETFYTYGALCSADARALSMAVMPFASTKIKRYKAWMTRIRQFTVPNAAGGPPIRVPMFAHLTKITSVMTKNEKGSWFLPMIEPGDPRGLMESLLSTDDERFLMAKACYLVMQEDENKLKVDYAQSDTAEEDDTPDAF